MSIEFYKYQGTGNDFVMIDDRALQFPIHNTELVGELCDRRFGIGADGLILLQQPADTGLYMKYYNSDGRESSMCGNGGRCFAAFAHYLGITGNQLQFAAIDGDHAAQIFGEEVRLQMKDVSNVERRTGDVFVLDTGSPHYVSFKNSDLHTGDLMEEARAVRYGKEFNEKGINVNFIQASVPGELRIRTYERGVEAETLSCGTGVTASALSYALFVNLSSGHHELTLHSEGGQLKVSFDFDAEKVTFTNIWLQGGAEQVYRGSFLKSVRKF